MKYKITVKLTRNERIDRIREGVSKESVVRRFVKDNKDLLINQILENVSRARKSECMLFITINEHTVDMHRITYRDILTVTFVDRLYVPLSVFYNRKPQDVYQLYRNNQLVKWERIEEELNTMDTMYRKYNTLYDEMLHNNE